MAYKTSQPRRTFDADIHGYRRVLSLVDLKPINPTIRQYVVSAAVFLGHASFENYIKDLFGSLAKALSLQGVTTEKLPKELRMYLLAQSANWPSHFANFNANGDERKLLQNLGNLLGNPSRFFMVDGVQVPSVVGMNLLSKKSYPSEDNLQRVFERIGIPNVFDVTSAILKANARLLLKGFADKRTELAHNAVMPGTSAQDIQDELKRFAAFVGAIDRVSYAHITKLVGQKTWYIAATQ